MSAFEIFRDNKKREYTESDISERYRNLSTKCAVLKWISLIVLVIYVIFSVSIHGEELSFDSIRYVVRYMKDDPVSLISNGDSIFFDYDSKNNAFLIGDDFAIVGSDGITIYDFSGKVLFSDKYIYDEPAAVTNGNELIVYNIGGTEARFYNSYSLIHRITFESPLYNVSVSENSNYIFQTASEGYRSGFRVYDKSKDMVFRNNFGELTLQTAAICPSGNLIAAATFSTSENKISSSISLYDISKPKAINEFVLNGEYPLDIEFLNNELIVLFTNKSIRFLNNNLENTHSYFYGDRTPLKYKITEQNVVVTYSNSTLSQNNEVEVYFKGGADHNKFIVDSAVLDAYCEDNLLHLLFSDSIKTYSSSDFKLISSQELSQSFSRLVRIDNNKFLLSRTDKVEMFIYDSLTK